MPQQDPLASLGTPAVPATATSDPLASLGSVATTAPPAQPSVIARSVEGAKQFAQPVADLVKPPETPTEQVVHAIGGMGGANPTGGVNALAAYRMAKNLVTLGEKVVTSGPAEYAQARADFSRAAQEFHDHDYRNAISSAVSGGSDALAMVPGSPMQITGPAVRELSEAARPGGNLATPLTRDALNVGAAALGSRSAAPEEEATAAPASTLRVNPFRRLVQKATASPATVGEETAAPLAKAAVQNVVSGPSLRSGIDVNTPFADAKTLYRTVDEAGKTNFQDLYEKLDSAMDRARQAGSGSAEEAKAQLDIKNTQDTIDEAKAMAAKSGVTDVDKTLAQADAKFTEAQANKDFNSKLSDLIKGNVANKVEESLPVDRTLDMLEKMDKSNKYGVSRLRQTSLGPAGADKLKQAIYDAKTAGKTAMDAREFRNTLLKIGVPGVTGAIGLGYELSK